MRSDHCSFRGVAYGRPGGAEMPFIIVLSASVAAVVVLLTTESALPWKLLAAGIVAASVAMEFVPALRTSVLVPLVMQIVVAVAVFLYVGWPRDV